MRRRTPEFDKPDEFSLTNTKLNRNHDTMANSGCVAKTELMLSPSVERFAKLPATRMFSIGLFQPIKI